MTTATIARHLPGDDEEFMPDATPIPTPRRHARPETPRPPNRPLGTWSDELVERLRALVAAGRSNSQIAQALGPGVTKNMVAGKLHRLAGAVHRPPRPAPEPKAPPAPKAARRERAKKPAAEARPMAVMIDRDARRPRPKPRPEPAAPPRPRVSDFRTCQWIAGAPSWDDACKCGAPTLAGSNYCGPHHARAWQSRDPELDQAMKRGARRIADREVGR